MATGKAGKTRSRILEAARTLFNEQGERMVSTNHIAAHLGMSPGNLYYHYRNKAGIIRELFRHYTEAVQKALAVSEGYRFTLEDKRQVLESTVSLTWHYRFLFRDMEYLLAENSELQDDYHAFSRQAVSEIAGLSRRMRSAGIIVLEDWEQQALVTNTWLVLVSWIGFPGSTLERERVDISQGTIRRALYQIMMLDWPYIAEECRESFRQLLQEYAPAAVPVPA